ncbi:cytochrome c oxidase cbb3-type subunit 3 [Thiogranum longum]|uniref:Cytochrome c oxidase cbb3-type subunit 3 n=1 Tax=Thiogranum longum TaxID=1537524 RepID=A0A4V2PGH5_9GAMM|nr:c-type cytochrome [Thiogranum longum]TCK16826.1 cytochrome c oxidase cbb3-type subunit 3 [Thiogranum longum]
MKKQIQYLFTVLALMTATTLVAQADHSDGDELYQQHCAACHGSDGSGGVGVPLNLPDFLAVASDDYLRKTVRNGRPGRVMPAFPLLSEDEVGAIIQTVRGWSGVPPPDYDSKPLKGDAVRGKQLFTQYCVACHGERGQGGEGTGVTFSRPREAPIMAPALNNPGFQQSVSDAMLKATLLRGRHGTPMPSITELGLKEGDADDLVAWLRQLPADSAPVRKSESPVIRMESSYSFEETLDNLKKAISARNFRVIREQTLDSGFVEKNKESRRQYIVYFCSFSFLNEALSIDPRVGLFLPCRVTLQETEKGIELVTINPENLSHLFNNRELDKACERMHRLYTEILEEATL